MQETFKNAVEAFITNNLDGIRKFAGWFAKAITLNLMKGNKEELQRLYKDAAFMRSDIEFTETIKMTKDYYLGYCSAYENVARKLLEEENNQENIEIVAGQLPKLRLQKIINFLGNQRYAQQNEVASHLDITPSHLCNILNNPSVKELEIFSIRKIGKHAIYGLNKKGKQYYQDKIDRDKKQYSKKQIFDLLSLVMKNYDSLEAKVITESAKIIDEELVKELYKFLYEFTLRKDLISSPQTDYSRVYKNIIQKENIEMKNKVSTNYQYKEYVIGQAEHGKIEDKVA
jgi:hypothetical protein